jgi:hypothetical protein
MTIVRPVQSALVSMDISNAVEPAQTGFAIVVSEILMSSPVALLSQLRLGYVPSSESKFQQFLRATHFIVRSNAASLPTFFQNLQIVSQKGSSRDRKTGELRESPHSPRNNPDCPVEFCAS